VCQVENELIMVTQKIGRKRERERDGHDIKKRSALRRRRREREGDLIDGVQVAGQVTID
jgi:hypothetical protein